MNFMITYLNFSRFTSHRDKLTFKSCCSLFNNTDYNNIMQYMIQYPFNNTNDVPVE